MFVLIAAGPEPPKIPSAWSKFDQTVTPRPVFTRTALDTTGNVGVFSSITTGSDGLGLISYLDGTNLDLKVAHCPNIACTSATITTLDGCPAVDGCPTTDDVGRFTSITIGSDGLGLISYFDNTNDDLKVAHCDDVDCTSATITALDTTDDVTSITIGSDGLGLISYIDDVNLDLKVAHCDDVACSSATITALDTTDDVGIDSSITIGSDGFGLISYLDFTSNEGDLKVAHCTNVDCTTFDAPIALDTVGDVGFTSSITIGSDGLGLISYFDLTNTALKVAHCDDVACSSATINTLDDTSDIGRFTSITIGSDGLGLISYADLDGTFALQVAHCDDVACSSATTTALDTVGSFSSITIGSDGLGLISYFDGTNLDLKVAHCSNAFCIPFFRRR